jgi:hypothetical protein
MKKILNYYLPIALYCASLLFVFISIFFVERTPETEDVIVEYQPAILNFVASYILFPLVLFSYLMYFLEIIFFKINNFLLKRYLKKCNLPDSCFSTEDRGTLFQFITASFVFLFSIVNFFL